MKNMHCNYKYIFNSIMKPCINSCNGAILNRFSQYNLLMFNAAMPGELYLMWHQYPWTFGNFLLLVQIYIDIPKTSQEYETALTSQYGTQYVSSLKSHKFGLNSKVAVIDQER